MNTDRHQHISLLPFAAHGRLRRVGGLLLTCLALLTLTWASPKAAAQDETMIVMPTANQGMDYNEVVASAGTAPYTWTLLERALPPGLTLHPDGRLRGRPTAHSPTPYRFRVRVTDSSVPPRTNEQWLSVAVLPPPSLIPVTAGRTVVAAPTPAPLAPPQFVLTTSTSDEETIALAQRFDAAPPPPTFAADTDPANIANLRAIIARSIGTSARNFQDGDYCVLHVILWKPLVENKSEPDREIWALFRASLQDPNTVAWEPVIDQKNKELFNTRIMGEKRVAVLLAHLNTPAAWDVKYKVTVTQKIPVPIQHALELLTSITGGGGLREATGAKDIWGARMMLIKYTASEIVVKVNAVTSSTGRPVEQSKEHAKSYDNEGKYHWDVSVGLPVKSVRELQFKSDGNRVFAEAKERQSVYGFLNLYPKAVDLKSDDFFTFPHIVLGVPLASKPLHRPFAGVGTGLYKMPIKFNIFAGIVFNRERVPRTLGEGAAATAGQLEADLHTRWVRKFMFGINLPVSQIKDAIKK